MPTYEYRCGKCDHAFEIFEAVSAESVKACPACGKKAAKRGVGGGIGLIFKGAGFYINDYARKGSAAPAEKGCAAAKTDAECGCEKKKAAAATPSVSKN